MEPADEDNLDFASAELGLSDGVVRGVFAYGLEQMSPVQSKAIPILLSGKDAVVQAQSGTGKTAAFGISCIERCVRFGKFPASPVVLVACHTRELAMQTTSVLASLAQYTDVSVCCFVGGTPISASRTTLRAGCDIAIGTPGRLEALYKRGALELSRIGMLVIDEVDEVLRDSSTNCFLPLIQTILAGCPDTAQIVLVSATISPELLDMVGGMLRDPVKLLMETKALPLAGIQQLHLQIEDESHRYDALRHAQRSCNAMQSMVFCARRDTVDDVVRRLREDGCDAAALHSGFSAADRQGAMERFRAGDVRVLVCTDVLARGVDVQQVGLVVMYELCASADTYLHCVGRCGRYGRQGRAVLIVNAHEEAPLRSYQALYEFPLVPHN